MFYLFNLIKITVNYIKYINIYKTITTWEPSKAKRFPINKKEYVNLCKLHKINKRQDKTSVFLHVYYHEVKKLRMIENSHNSTLTFLFGAVLTDDFKYWAVLTKKLGRFELGPVFD